MNSKNKKREIEKYPLGVGYLSCEEARYNRRFLYLIVMLLIASIQEASARDPFTNGFEIRPSINRPNTIFRGSQQLTSQGMGSNPNPGSGSNPGSGLNQPGYSTPGFKGKLPMDIVHPVSPTQKKPKKVEDECSIDEIEDELDEIEDQPKSGQIRMDKKKRFIEVNRLDGITVTIMRDQVRDKFHHVVLFPEIKIPDTFDMKYAASLAYKDRLVYYRNVDILPDETVEQLMMKMGAFVADQNSRAVKGTIGPYKTEGTLLINSTQRRIFFFNKRDNQFRTMADVSPTQMRKVTANNFHLPFGEKKKK